jgi:hypothetical protein
MMDQFVVSMYADNVRAAHEGLLEKRLVFGTISFGYKGEPIEGQFTKRKRPRSLLAIDPEAAPWVVRIFKWYVEDRLPVEQIVHRLNDDPAIPLPPRSATGAWNRNAVLTVLRNTRYRGLWRYGVTEAVWLSSKDYARKVVRQEPLKEAQIEDLRLVPDDLWYAAQSRLAKEDRSAAGRKPRDGDRRSRPRLLNGLFRCPEHDQILYVGGVHGHYMFCKACKGLHPDKRPLYSQLPRGLALHLTCERLAGLVRGDDDLVAQVIAACQQEVEQEQRGDPAALDELRNRQGRLSRQIAFLLQDAGETEADRRESAQTLKELRRARAEVAAEISRLEASQGRPVVVPTKEEVQALLDDLVALLSAAAGGGGEEVAAAREAIELLTGGRIDLFQQGERKAQRGWLQGRFHAHLLPYLLGRAIDGAHAPAGREGALVVIDYRESTEAEGLADRVKELYDRGLLIKAVARELGIRRNLARRALACWYQQRGLDVPDGRSRRSSLAEPHDTPPLYQRVAEQAKRLWDDQLLIQEIAQQMGCNRETVTKAVAFWHDSRGLPIPDGRTRRKGLDRKIS